MSHVYPFPFSQAPPLLTQIEGNGGVYSVTLLQPGAGSLLTYLNLLYVTVVCTCVCVCLDAGSFTYLILSFRSFPPLPLTQSVKRNSSILKLSYSLSFFSYNSKPSYNSISF